MERKFLLGLAASALLFIVLCGGVQYFHPINADSWTAIGTMILAFSTTALFIVAAYQLSAVRQQISDTFNDNKMLRTLDACNRYDFDPILDGALKRLKAKRDDRSSEYYRPDATKLKLDVLTVINYLDGIAIGIEQNVYIEDLAKDHLREILISHCKDYLAEPNASRFGVNAGNFSRLKQVYDRWVNPGTAFSNGSKGKGVAMNLHQPRD